LKFDLVSRDDAIEKLIPLKLQTLKEALETAMQTDVAKN
jgi:hypothetical protein